MVGPTASTNSISPVASTMLSSDRFFTPLSSPATTEAMAMQVMMAMVITCTVMSTGTSHR